MILYHQLLTVLIQGIYKLKLLINKICQLCSTFYQEQN